jgi:formylglycine-generating enzyme required for sulfatase activity
MAKSQRSILENLADRPTLQAIRRHLTMGSCCLLGAAIESGPAVIDPLKRLRESISTSGTPHPFFPQRLFDARMALIDAYLSEGIDSIGVRKAIREVIDATDEAWQHVPTQSSIDLNEALAPKSKTGLAKPLEPSFVAEIAAQQRLGDLLRKFAGDNQIGWTHPGLQMAGGMLASLINGRHAAPELTVETVVFFANDSPDDPSGVLARLRIGRMKGGCGLLIPDAMSMGYTLMDKSFAIGLQNALHAARGYVLERGWNDGRSDYDWRWSLELLHANTTLPKSLKKSAQIPISGRSAEVAFACAMIAAAKGNPDNSGDNPDNGSGHDPLDPHVGITAMFDLAASPGKENRFDGLPIVRVESVDAKTLLGPMKRMRVDAILVGHDQPELSLPKDTRYTFPKVSTLAKAYEAMVRFPRITRKVNREIARQANALLQKECTPLICPRIAWEPREPTDKQPLEKAPERILLNDKQFRQLVSGRSPQVDNNAPSNRFWVCAESGLGKSVFILYCQRSIAKRDQGLVPIRLGRTAGNDFGLSAIPSWQELSPEKIVALPEVTVFLDAAFPKDSPQKLSADERLRWFKWLWEHGRVVFLLDALDQTDRDMQDLGHFLQSGQTRECVAIMTGRPESLTNQAKAFRGNIPWINLRLMPFDRERQAKYLGSELAEALIPPEEKVDYEISRDPDALRRHHWKELLEVPLLLKLLKDLASRSQGRLDNINSKYDIYNLSVKHLIEQASEKIEDPEQRSKIEGNERELLEQIAWFMIGNSESSNQLVGDGLAKLKRRFKDQGNDAQLLDLIARINVATLWQIMERSASGLQQKTIKALAFRHRSFMEYFAGCYLAQLAKHQEPVKLAECESTLTRIHRMLDDRGNVCADLLPHVDRPSIWHDTLRFALAAATPTARERLARRLIELGNPWVIYQSIARDRVPFAPDTEAVTRRLVHRDRSYKYDYSNALQSDDATRLQADREACQRYGLNAAEMLSVSTRDAAWMRPLRDMMGDAIFAQTVSRESSVLERMRQLRGGTREAPHWDFLGSFVKVKGGRYEPQRYHRHITAAVIEIADFELADFPVTNELFELFCPSHRRWRDQYSEADDQPAVYVSHDMAVEFCEWLSAIAPRRYRLPTDWEWEWAARWLCDRAKSPHADDQYWWGPKMDDRLCWYGAFSDGPARSSQRTRSRSEAIDAFTAANRWHPSRDVDTHPGLVDLLGNAWEWSANLYSNAESYRWLCGGSWHDNANNGSSRRFPMVTSDYRIGDFGFRLVCLV